MAQTIDACDVSPTYDKSQFLGHSETANRWDISNISVIFKFFFQDAYGHNFLFSLNHVKKNNNDMTYLLILSPRKANPCGPSQDNRTPATVVEINGRPAY
jgi:predicted Zn-ribbon and HTH transcriptional regulator